jgi:hypothetical protein
MNAVVQHAPRPALVAGDRPHAIVPTSVEQVWRLAELVSKSGLAPKEMASPEKCAIAILHGLEVGLPPMYAVQRIAVINGRPSIWGDAALGLARASGLLEHITETVEGEGDNRAAHCAVKRKGEDPVTRSFSVEDAKTAGLWTKGGPWKQYPERMLQMRARGFALRDAFPDVLGGLYLAEELQGNGNGEMKDVTPAANLMPPDPDEQDKSQAGAMELQAVHCENAGMVAAGHDGQKSSPVQTAPPSPEQPKTPAESRGPQPAGAPNFKRSAD